MVMDSCAETYRLARWESVAGDRIRWEEDGARIEAAIAQTTPDALRLQLFLRNEVREENYRPASVPYVCPDSRPNPETSIRPNRRTVAPSHPHRRTLALSHLAPFGCLGSSCATRSRSCRAAETVRANRDRPAGERG